MRNLAYIAQRNQDSGEAPGDAFAAMSGESLDDVVIPAGQEKPAGELEIQKTPEEIAAEKVIQDAKSPEQIEAEKLAAEAAEKKPILDADGNEIQKTEFTAEDLEGAVIGDSTEEDTANWKELGGLLEMEVADDTQEAFVAADKIRIENIKKQAIAEHLIKTQQMKPEAIRLVEAFNNGATEIGIHKVEAPYRDFLAFSPEDKVKQVLIAANHNEEYAQRIVDKHIEEGTLDDEVARIDADVKGRMAGKVNEYFSGLEAIAKQERQATLDRIASENKLVEQAIFARSEFSGLKVSEDVRKQIIARWNNGTYRQAFESDPNAVVDFIFERELGKKAREITINDKTRGFRHEVQGKLQTLDQARQASATSAGKNTVIQTIDPADPFKGWENINSDEIETRTVVQRR